MAGKRRSTSPIIDDEKIAHEVEKELNVSVKSFNVHKNIDEASLVPFIDDETKRKEVLKIISARCESIIGTAEAVLREKVLQKASFRFKYGVVREDRRDLRNQMRNVELERNLAQAKLKLRPYLEILERTVFPPWLLDSDFPYKIRWIVSVQFSLTPDAAILLKRVKSTKGITVEILAEAMVEFFHQSSDEVQHDKKPGVIILKETEWNLVFHELKIFRNDHKRVIKMALEDIKDNEEPEESSPLDQNKNWVIYVNIIPFNLQRFGPENAQDEIIRCCTVEEQHFKGFYFPMCDERKRFTHEVFFVIENVPRHSINQCKTNLLKWEPRDAQRFVRYDEAHLYHLP